MDLILVKTPHLPVTLWDKAGGTKIRPQCIPKSPEMRFMFWQRRPLSHCLGLLVAMCPSAEERAPQQECMRKHDRTEGMESVF